MSASFDRPAKNPGGMQCEQCDVIFVGEEWHALCALCDRMVTLSIHPDPTGTAEK